MKVTVKNEQGKPVNISRLAPLMPQQVLGVNQEITVNVKDIESVIKKAEEIGVTVTPLNSLEITQVPDNSNIIDTIGDGQDDNSNTQKDDTNEVETDTENVDEKQETVKSIVKNVIKKKSTKKSVRNSGLKNKGNNK